MIGEKIMNRYKGIVVAALCMSVLAVSGCDIGGGDDIDMDSMMEDEVSVSVETSYPTVRTIAQPGTFIGTIETGDKVSVTPRVSGYVKEKFFGLGDVVNAGDVLFTIDDSSLKLEKEKAEADVRDANASLAKEKAENEATKFEVNETLNTLDTKTQENYNTIQKAIRSEYESQLDLYKACATESIHKDEGNYLEDLIKKDKDGLESAKEFAKELKGFKTTYEKISKAGTVDEAVAIAVEKGVDRAAIEGMAQDQIALYYLSHKTMYDNMEQLEKAIATSESAEETAKTTLAQHESSDRTNDLAIISDEVTIEKEKGNIATAAEDLALKRKVAADYEIFTKAKIWAASQAKLAAGDASVLSSNVKLSKAQIDLQIAEMKLKNTSVTSPVTGEIVECKIEDFGTASDSSVAYTIIDTSKKKAVFYVTDDAKHNVAVGQTVIIDKGGNQYNATVDHVSDTPDEKKMLYRITAVLGESDKDALDAGTNVRLITNIRRSDNTLTLPIGVIYYDEGRPFVYVAKDGKARRTDVETGIDDGTDIEIVSGLSADDEVIVN